MSQDSQLAFVRRLVDKIVMDWKGTSPKRMFGSDAWFAQANIFSLLDPGTRQVGVKLTEPAQYARARTLRGASDFKPGGDDTKPMRAWVMLPPTLCLDEESLEPYLREAYDAAMSLPAKLQKNRGRAWLE